MILHNQRGQVSDGIFWTCSCDFLDVDAMGMWEWWISFIGMQTSYHRDIGYTTVKNDDFGCAVFFLISLRELRENKVSRPISRQSCRMSMYIHLKKMYMEDLNLNLTEKYNLDILEDCNGPYIFGTYFWTIYFMNLYISGQI